MTASEESPTDQQIVYLTGDNAAGKSTLGQYIADTHSDWHCVDGDRLVENDPALNELIVSVSKPTIDLLRGPFGDENLIETVKSHDAGVRTTWEPFFRVLFERLKQMKERGMTVPEIQEVSRARYEKFLSNVKAAKEARRVSNGDSGTSQ